MGLHFRAIAALVLAAACSDPGPLPGVSRRVLVVGWDGATFELLDPLLDAGRLPHLARLRARGTAATLESTAVPISSAAWTTIATGKEPGHTGVYSFFQPIPGSSDVRVVSARDVRSAPLWRTLVARGHEVLVWGVPITWPPEPVRGVLVAGMLSPEDEVWTYPAELTEAFRARGLAPDLGVWRTMRELTPERVQQQLALKEQAVLEALRSPRWTFGMVVFKELDVLSHRAYDGDPSGFIAGFVVELDRILGAMLDAVGPETDVFLISDHGFTTYPNVFDVDAWLVEAGFATRRDDAALSENTTGPLAVARANERSERLARLDWADTSAYADVAEGNYAALRLNLAGREAHGSVSPELRAQTLAELEQALLSVRDAAGAPVVTQVLQGDALYPGPERERIVPDLVIELAPGWRAVTQGLGPALQRGVPRFPEHARDGVAFAAGPSFVRSAAPERPRWRLIDLAPTWLHALGEPIPSGLTGAMRAELFRVQRPIVRTEEGADPSVRSTEDAYRGLPTPAQSAEVQKRLSALGYSD